MQRGYIKIWRKLEDSGLLQMPNTLALFMVMLFRAAYKPCKIGLVELERGQLSAGRFQLCEWTGLSEQNIRTSIKHLHDMKILTSKPTNKFTVYTIVNYGQYQDYSDTPNQQTNQQLTNNQPTTNQQLTTEEDINTLSIKELNTIVPNGTPDCPHEKIVSAYHELLPSLSGVKILTDKRKALLKARWRDDESRQSIEWWTKYFKYVSTIPFLLGSNDRNWQVDFEWLINSSNLVKVIEGKYENRQS